MGAEEFTISVSVCGVYVHECICAEVRCQHRESSSSSNPHFWGWGVQGLLMNLKLASLATLGGQ